MARTDRSNVPHIVKLIEISAEFEAWINDPCITFSAENYEEMIKVLFVMEDYIARHP